MATCQDPVVSHADDYFEVVYNGVEDVLNFNSVAPHYNNSDMHWGHQVGPSHSMYASLADHNTNEHTFVSHEEHEHLLFEQEQEIAIARPILRSMPRRITRPDPTDYYLSGNVNINCGPMTFDHEQYQNQQGHQHQHRQLHQQPPQPQGQGQTQAQAQQQQQVQVQDHYKASLQGQGQLQGLLQGQYGDLQNFNFGNVENIYFYNDDSNGNSSNHDDSGNNSNGGFDESGNSDSNPGVLKFNTNNNNNHLRSMNMNEFDGISHPIHPLGHPISRIPPFPFGGKQARQTAQGQGQGEGQVGTPIGQAAQIGQHCQPVQPVPPVQSVQSVGHGIVAPPVSPPISPPLAPSIAPSIAPSNVSLSMAPFVSMTPLMTPGPPAMVPPPPICPPIAPIPPVAPVGPNVRNVPNVPVAPMTPVIPVPPMAPHGDRNHNHNHSHSHSHNHSGAVSSRQNNFFVEMNHTRTPNANIRHRGKTEKMGKMSKINKMNKMSKMGKVREAGRINGMHGLNGVGFQHGKKYMHGHSISSHKKRSSSKGGDNMKNNRNDKRQSRRNGGSYPDYHHYDDYHSVNSVNNANNVNNVNCMNKMNSMSGISGISGRHSMNSMNSMDSMKGMKRLPHPMQNVMQYVMGSGANGHGGAGVGGDNGGGVRRDASLLALSESVLGKIKVSKFDLISYLLDEQPTIHEIICKSEELSLNGIKNCIKIEFMVHNKVIKGDCLLECLCLFNKGSRHIQNEFELALQTSSDNLEIQKVTIKKFYHAIKEFAGKLCMDKYGNFVINKFATNAIKTRDLSLLKPFFHECIERHFLMFVSNKYPCRIIHNILNGANVNDVTKSDIFVEYLVDLLINCFMDDKKRNNCKLLTNAIKNDFANFIIQLTIEKACYFGIYYRVMFIVEHVSNCIVQFGKHKFACRIIQCILKFAQLKGIIESSLRSLVFFSSFFSSFFGSVVVKKKKDKTKRLEKG